MRFKKNLRFILRLLKSKQRCIMKKNDVEGSKYEKIVENIGDSEHFDNSK